MTWGGEKNEKDPSLFTKGLLKDFHMRVYHVNSYGYHTQCFPNLFDPRPFFISDVSCIIDALKNAL